MRNTRISYMYRDAGNNKYRGRFVVGGEVSLADLKPYLFDGPMTFADQFHFVPRAVGLDHLLTDKWDSELDHELHELEEFAATGEVDFLCTAGELLDRFKIASRVGWLEYWHK